MMECFANNESLAFNLSQKKSFLHLKHGNLLALRKIEHTDEQKLVQQLIDGKEFAFELLFYRYRGKVSDFINRSLPHHADLEELVHEIFLRIWMNKEKIDANRPFAPFLFKVARNMLIDEMRKSIDHTIYLNDQTFETDSGVNNTELKIEESELQKWFQSLLNKLPEKRKNIFELNRFEGLSYKEIGKKLNISENTVDTQIRRTLKFLREEIRKIKMIIF